MPSVSWGPSRALVGGAAVGGGRGRGAGCDRRYHRRWWTPLRSTGKLWDTRGLLAGGGLYHGTDGPDL